MSEIPTHKVEGDAASTGMLQVLTACMVSICHYGPLRFTREMLGEALDKQYLVVKLCKDGGIEVRAQDHTPETKKQERGIRLMEEG